MPASIVLVISFLEARTTQYQSVSFLTASTQHQSQYQPISFLTAYVAQYPSKRTIRVAVRCKRLIETYSLLSFNQSVGRHTRLINKYTHNRSVDEFIQSEKGYRLAGRIEYKKREIKKQKLMTQDLGPRNCFILEYALLPSLLQELGSPPLPIRYWEIARKHPSQYRT